MVMPVTAPPEIVAVAEVMVPPPEVGVTVAVAVWLATKASLTVNVRAAAPTARLPLIVEDTTPVGVEAETATTLLPRVVVVPVAARPFTVPPLRVREPIVAEAPKEFIVPEPLTVTFAELVN